MFRPHYPNELPQGVMQQPVNEVRFFVVVPDLILQGRMVNG